MGHIQGAGASPRSRRRQGMGGAAADDGEGGRTGRLTRSSGAQSERGV